MEKTVLVIGATGMLGKPVAMHLKESGFQVRVLARNKDKARKMLDSYFEIVEGEVTNIESLETALDGCFGVHINLSGDIEQPGAQNIASAASGKGLQRITYISGTSVCEENTWFPLIKHKLLAEKSIHESGVPYTVFRPTWFMEVIPNFVKETRAFVFGKQSNPYHLIAADDYARMVAASYSLDEAANKTFFIHGGESILLGDAVERYCSALHPDIKKISTLPYWLVNIISILKRNKEMKGAGKFSAYFEKVGERGDPTEANTLLSAPKTTFDDWLGQRKPEL
ncbi:MAG: NAD(P)H-binding protein [Candidatus Hatepunaea meridiana]|nr:NAD(P)H-binding protein [Candidatus Hatepunaea meridiana]